MNGAGTELLHFFAPPYFPPIFAGVGRTCTSSGQKLNSSPASSAASSGKISAFPRFGLVLPKIREVALKCKSSVNVV